jgi:hypothetical protein
MEVYMGYKPGSQRALQEAINRRNAENTAKAEADKLRKESFRFWISFIVPNVIATAALVISIIALLK